MDNKKEFEQQKTEKVTFGFWIYLMTDVLMFAALFATFAVLRNATFGGPSGKELFDLPNALTETLILLTSSFTCGLAIIATHKKNKNQTLFFLIITFLLGIAFLSMELSEFSSLISSGNGYSRNAFLSSFFTLVGTHGLHIFAGLFWLLLIVTYILKRGLTESISRKLTLFSMFWHFLDLVWIFIFTVVYLMGKV